MTLQTYQASCHCGAVRFSFEAEPITKGVRCNCSFCSRRGTLMQLVPDAQFHLAAGEDALNFYQFGPKRAKHYFCRTCGIHTFSVTTRRPDQHIVNLGCVQELDTYALEPVYFDGKHLL